MPSAKSTHVTLRRAALGALLIAAAAAPQAAQAASISSTVEYQCKVYDPSGTFVPQGPTLEVRVTGNLPSSVPQGQPVTLTNAVLNASIDGRSVNTMRAYGDVFTGSVTRFQVAVAGTDTASVNLADAPATLPYLRLPSASPTEPTASLSWTAPDTGTLPPITVGVATGAIGSSVKISAANVTKSFDAPITFERNSMPRVPFPYELGCVPAPYADDDGTVAQDLTLATIPITAPGPVVPEAPVVSGLSVLHARPGDVVAVIGDDLTGVDSVTIGGVPATFGIDGPGSLRVAVPSIGASAYGAKLPVVVKRGSDAAVNVPTLLYQPPLLPGHVQGDTSGPLSCTLDGGSSPFLASAHLSVQVPDGTAINGPVDLRYFGLELGFSSQGTDQLRAFGETIGGHPTKALVNAIGAQQPFLDLVDGPESILPQPLGAAGHDSNLSIPGGGYLNPASSLIATGPSTLALTVGQISLDLTVSGGTTTTHHALACVPFNAGQEPTPITIRVEAAPAVTNVTGIAIAGVGGVATITGTKLGGANAVLIGGKAAPIITKLGSTRVVVRAPKLPVGTYDVQVRTPSGFTANTSRTKLTYRSLF